MAGIDSYTKLLLHTDTDFSDSSFGAKTATLVNTPTIDGTNKKFGAGSGLFVAASSQAVTFADSADWAFGTGDFAVDCWIKTSGTNMIICGTCDAAGSSGLSFSLGVGIFVVNKASFTASMDGTTWGVQLSSTTSVNDGNFHHIAGVRSGNRFDLYVDGVSEANATNAGTVNDSAEVLALGRLGAYVGGLFFNGNVDEFRVSKGVPRWTANFNPPILPYSRGGGLTTRSFYWGA